MEATKTMSASIAVASLIVVWWFASWLVQTSLASHQHELGIRAYFDCVTKYAAGKASGKFPEGVTMPSASEVCEKYKR